MIMTYERKPWVVSPSTLPCGPVNDVHATVADRDGRRQHRRRWRL